MDCRGRNDEQSLTVAIPLRYSTIYTMFPVFSLVLDKDVKSEVAMLYPELYKDLLKVLQPSPTSTPLPPHLSLLFSVHFSLAPPV